jgi:CTP synthase
LLPFCNVEERAVITAKDVASIYEVPLTFAQEGVDALMLKYLHMEAKEPTCQALERLVDRCYNPKDKVSIGIVGKYVEYEDSYKSLKEALVHGALAHNLKLQVTWIEAEGLESNRAGDRQYETQLEGFDGILVPGGFGKRGIEGMLNAIRYARENAGSVLSVSAWGCRRPASSLRAMSAGCGRQLQRVRSGCGASHHLQAA